MSWSNRRGKTNKGNKFPTPPKPDWERETLDLDSQLTVRIERLLEQRRLRETVKRVASRPPLAGRIQGERGPGSLPTSCPPPADYIDGPGGKNSKKKRKKKKKKTKEKTATFELFGPSPSAASTSGVRVIEETTLRGRDIIPVSRYKPQETWVEVVRRRPRGTTTNNNVGIVRLPPPPPPVQRGAAGVKPQKPPSSSAVTMTCPPGSYEVNMRKAKVSINPEDLEITRMRFKPHVLSPGLSQLRSPATKMVGRQELLLSDLPLCSRETRR